ncbi:hypothetical protein VZT92_023836 [Zoarces viviparus]|uniref:Uncharacterized protein n=1 Tax=Zoarces viviparus TaxID=48416 RepID=A0AAW1E8A1_ZOAVI
MRRVSLGGGGSEIRFLPRHCPSACHQQQRRVRRGTKTAAGSIPSARLIAFAAARPPFSLYLQLRSVPAVRTRGTVGWEDKERRKTLDSGRLLFLAKAAIIIRATPNKIVQARLGN